MDLLLGEAELPEEIVHMHELKCEGALDVVTDFEKFEDLLLPPLRLQELPSTLRANQEFRHQYTKYCALVGILCHRSWCISISHICTFGHCA